MRTDVKVGVALSAVVLIIAVSYYGTKKKPEDVQLADAADKVRDQNAKTLDGLLSSGPNQPAKADKDKKAGENARPSGATQQRPRPRPGGAAAAPASTPDKAQASRTNLNRPPVRPLPNGADSSADSGLVSKPAPAETGPTLEQSSVLPARPATESARDPMPSPTVLKTESALNSGGPLAAGSAPPAGSNPSADSVQLGGAGPVDATRQPDGVAQSTPTVVSSSLTHPASTAASPARDPQPSAETGRTLPPLRTPSQPRTSTQVPLKSPMTGGPTALKTGGSRQDVGTSTTPAVSAAPDALGTPAPSAPRTHVVASGDSFAKLAERYYGSQKHVRVLVAANPTVNPQAMKIGATITIPPLTEAPNSKPEARTKPGPGQHPYTVQNGDTLYTIAEKHLGTGNRWPEIYELNKEEVGNDPMTLRVGNVILLPVR